MSTLESIHGIGHVMKEKLNNNDIFDVYDILDYFPKKYENYELAYIESILKDEQVCILGTVIKAPVNHYIRKNLSRLSFEVIVLNKAIKVVIFNRGFLKNRIIIGKEVVLIGKLDKYKMSFTASSIKLRENFQEGIKPIYNLKDINDITFSKIIKNIYDKYGCSIKDDMPFSLLKKYKLIDKNTLLKVAHNPKSNSDIHQVKRRVKYEELFKFQLKLRYLKIKKMKKSNDSKDYDLIRVKKFIESLPFELTSDQKKATNEIMIDLKSPHPMNRLLQGDVGSGKTIVSVITMYAVVSSGYQVALMSPTEILAEQHYNNIKELLINFNLNIAFLSSNVKTKDKTNTLKLVKNGEIDIIIGTHSLIQDDISFKRLGFVITDEQHRFGVNQRKRLREKGNNPDVLFMTATPIPRTLAITLFGDMDVSIIKEMPLGRKPVITKIYKENELDKVLHFIETEITNGKQAYVITPLIEESENMDLKNVLDTFEEMKQYFEPKIKVGLIHGRQKSDEKEKVMKLFYENEINVLVSTTVVEVGVDVKNATVMVILDSHRFGLSQLHQLRGRVGRSDLQSYCFLVSDNLSQDSFKRLKIMEKVYDGFLLSNEDLKMRGPGDFFGNKQTGIPSFKMANLIEDVNILEVAREDAISLLQQSDFFSNKEYNGLHNYLAMEINKHTFD